MAPALRTQDREHRSQCVENTEDVDVEDRARCFIGSFLDSRQQASARVVDQDIDATEALYCRVHGVSEALLVGDIDPQRQQPCLRVRKALRTDSTSRAVA